MGGGEIAGKIIGNFFLTIVVSVGIGLISGRLSIKYPYFALQFSKTCDF
jgi:hypothetical protein